MCHTLKGTLVMICISYTIQRNGFYYFNYRQPTNQIIYRKSLKTDSARYCKELVGKIMKQIGLLKRMNILMDKDQLKQILDSILKSEVSHIKKTAKAALYPSSNESNALKKQYIALTSSARYYNHNVQQSQAMAHVGLDIPEKPIPTFKDYTVQNLIKNRDNRHYFSSWDEEEEQYIIDDDFLFIEHEPEYIAHEIDMKALKTQAINLKNLIASDRTKEAKESLDGIIESFTTNQLVTKQAAQVTSTKPKFSSLLNPYIEKLTIKNITEYRRHMKFFEYFLGDYHVDQIDRKQLDKMMGTFANMPLAQLDAKKGGSKSYIYKDYSLEKRINIALESDVEHLYLPSTRYIKSAEKVLTNFFLYLRKEDLIENDPVSSMLFDAKKVSKNKGYKRNKFSKKIASMIIDHCIKDTRNELHWATLIMAHTGARNSEVLQLRRQDIFRDDDSKILCFKITDKAGKTKTESSNRLIPIHSKLISLGFEDFYSNISSEKIFTKSVDNLNNWFNGLRTELCIPALSQNNELQDLYSFRHNVGSYLTIKNQSQKMINALLGHSNSDIGGNYTHIDNEDIAELKSVIENISYE
jgi:integrase